ncbi:MAG: agmatinase [bacterium]|jgi:agmatinase
MKCYSLSFLGSQAQEKHTEWTLFSAPFDSTVSFMPGSRFAGNALREASQNLEEYSPYLDKELDEVSFSDVGDLEIAPGNTIRALETIQQFVSSELDKNRKTAMIGGEHLVTFPALQAYAEKYPSFVLIQLDAHADLREDYLGEQFSHATVMRRCIELPQVTDFFQFGIRSGTKEEFQYIRQNQTLFTFHQDQFQKVREQIGNRPVYITIDLDVFDPAYLPGTGTPEPGGIDFHQFMSFLKAFQGIQLIGFDLVELNPLVDNSKISAILAAKVLREMLLITKFT